MRRLGTGNLGGAWNQRESQKLFICVFHIWMQFTFQKGMKLERDLMQNFCVALEYHPHISQLIFS